MPGWRERLWSKIDVRGVDECWLWQGSVQSAGYGVTCERLAHRAAYEDAVGTIAAGLVLRHLCEGRYAPSDNTYRRCCNPAHLSPGTRKQNHVDMCENGRYREPRRVKGEAHPSSKLTPGRVREMRSRYAVGGCTQKGLAAEFGVCPATVAEVLQRKIWRHVT